MQSLEKAETSDLEAIFRSIGGGVPAAKRKTRCSNSGSQNSFFKFNLITYEQLEQICEDRDFDYER